MSETVTGVDGPGPGRLVVRHPRWLRLTHWLNALALALLLMSGLQIFNAHPALGWGRAFYNGREPVVEIAAQPDAGGRLVGTTRILGHAFQTTGLLGVSREAGTPVARAFPSWVTVPGPFTWWDSQPLARSWHFFFAWVLVLNGCVHLAASLAGGHLRRDLLPTRTELRWRPLARSVLDHLRLRHPQGEAARRYNVLQKLSYLLVTWLLLPLQVALGCALSPRLDSLWPGWIDLFGGRESARTLHFIVALLLVAFTLVHVFEVVVTGLWNNLRSMITGRYRLRSPASGESP